MKPGDKVICKAFCNEIGKVVWYDPETEGVGIKYKGLSCIYEVHESLVEKV